MGMDNYIYRTTKQEHEAYLEYCKVCDNAWSEIRAYEKQLAEKYNDEHLFDNEADVIIKLITSEELEHYRSILKRTHYSGQDFPNELAYWRKAYGLNRFIIMYGNCVENSEDRIILSKDNIQAIINEMKRCKENFKEMDDDCIFGSHDYWDMEDLERSINVFEDILADYTDDDLIYYRVSC
jgi:hypothetical protein